MTVFKNPSRDNIAFTYAEGRTHIRLTVPVDIEGCGIGDIIKLSYDKLIGEYPFERELLFEVFKVRSGGAPRGHMFIYARQMKERE